jgi:hypothetical protein
MALVCEKPNNLRAVMIRAVIAAHVQLSQLRQRAREIALHHTVVNEWHAHVVNVCIPP